MKSFNKWSRSSRFFLLAALFVCAGSLQSATRKTITPNAVVRDVDAQGSAAVVRQLNAQGGRGWQQVLGGIEGGSPSWLSAAGKLLTGTDAGRTEDLHYALSIALTHNAAGVLGLVGPTLPVVTVCSVPFIEPSKQKIRSFTAKARAAVEAVTSPELAALKQGCLASLNRDANSTQ